MTLKQKIVHLIFYIECAVVFGFYMFGHQGVTALMQLHREVDKGRGEVAQVEQDIRQLEQDCVGWENDPFNVEQCAREKLAMSYEGEDIYVTK